MAIKNLMKKNLSSQRTQAHLKYGHNGNKKLIENNRFGFIQGRLFRRKFRVNLTFPINDWEKEFKITDN